MLSNEALSHKSRFKLKTRNVSSGTTGTQEISSKYLDDLLESVGHSGFVSKAFKKGGEIPLFVGLHLM